MTSPKRSCISHSWRAETSGFTSSRLLETTRAGSTAPTCCVTAIAKTSGQERDGGQPLPPPRAGRRTHPQGPSRRDLGAGNQRLRGPLLLPPGPRPGRANRHATLGVCLSPRFPSLPRKGRGRRHGGRPDSRTVQQIGDDAGLAHHHPGRFSDSTILEYCELILWCSKPGCRNQVYANRF